MGKITRVSTRDYLTEPLYSWDPTVLPKHRNKNNRPSSVEVLREHVDIIENENSVVLAKSHLLRGTTESGKKWTRFQTVSKDMIVSRPNKAGVLRLNYLRYSHSLGFRNITPFTYLHREMFDQSSVAIEAVYDFLERKIPERFEEWNKNHWDHWLLFYPGYTYTRFRNEPENVHRVLRVPLREENAMNFALAAFGKSHYRKDLVKAAVNVPHATHVNLETAVHLKRYLKTDWLVEIMRDERQISLGTLVNKDDLIRMQRVFSLIPAHRMRRFALSLGDHHQFHNRDAFFDAMYLNDEQIAGVRTVGELHEIAGAAAPRPVFARGGALPVGFEQVGVWDGTRTYTPPEPVEIALNELTEKYHDLETEDGLKIVAPNHSDMVDSWSDTMGNCIRSYAQRAAKGDTNLGAVYNGEKLVANFEISPKGHLKQLLGKFNQHLGIEMQHDIIDALEDCGVVWPGSVQNAWGVDLLVAR